MLYSEFIARSNDKDLEEWQYKMIEDVYCDHPSITDVGGQDQIAAIYNDGGLDVIYKMYRDIYPDRKTHPIITHHVTNLIENYDVCYEHYCHNCKNNTIVYLYEQIEEELKNNYPDIWNTIDYFSISCKYEMDMKNNPDLLIPDFQWMPVYYVRGGSEGFYIHIDVITPGNKMVHLYTAKTLCGRDEGERICNAITRIIDM